MKEYILGLDGGTGGMRAYVFDREGKVIGKGSSPYDTSYPSAGFAEQNAPDWISAAKESIRDAVSGIDPADIKALCAATTSCTVLCCSRTGEPLGPALLWMDVRASEQMKRINEKTGQSVSAESFVAKALWIKEKMPHVWEKCEVLCEYQDFLNYYFTGEWCLSANTGCNWAYNNRTKAFYTDFYREIGLSDALEKVPEKVYSAGEVIGKLTKAAAEELGLLEGTPVVQGGIDSSVGMLGMGTARPGRIALMTGSSNLAMAVTEKPMFVPETAVNAGPDFLLKGYYTSVQGQAATGSVLHWFRRELCKDLGMDSLKELDAAAEKVDVGSGGVVLLDYWQGNRYPYNDPDAAGCFVGITMNTTREQMYRAVLEGVAYGTLDVLNGFAAGGHPVDAVNISGGFTRSDIFLQIYADVCGVPFHVTSDYSVALGSAILCAFALGWYGSLEKAVDSMVVFSKTVSPDEENHKLYEKSFQRYKGIYKGLKSENVY